VEAAIIAAMYAVLTIFFPWSSGQIQVRISEALTILPFFTPAAIPGLFTGCFIANILVPSGAGVIDMIFGSLATLTAAYLSYKMPRKYLVPLPPVVINAVAVAGIWKAVAGLPFFVTMAWVAAGEIIACYGLGYPLLLILEKHRSVLFKPFLPGESQGKSPEENREGQGKSPEGNREGKEYPGQN